MNKEDTEFYEAFIDYIGNYMEGTIESFISTFRIPISNVHFLKTKSKMKKAFYINANLDQKFIDFMTRNCITFEDAKNDIFDRLWDNFCKKNPNIIV